jgi:hypothetical protein
MKLLLKQTRVNNEDALGVAIEFAMILGVFFAAGWALDAALGLFAKSKYRYDAKMEALEAERLERRAAASPAESPEIR